MKKLLGAALGLALLIPSGPASAELLKNLKIDGGLDVRAVDANGLLDMSKGLPDHISTVETRTLLNVGWDLLDDVHANVTLRKNDRTWGTDGSGPNAASQNGNQSVVGTPSEGGFLNNVAIQQANVKIDKVFGALDVTAGRQYYGEPGDFAIAFGPKGGNGQYVTAIDAFRVDNDNDWVKWSGLVGDTQGAQTGTGYTGVCGNALGNSSSAASVPGNTTTAFGAFCPTQTVTGVDTWIKNLPVKFGPFLWWRRTQLGEAADNLWLYGVRLRAEGMGAWLSLDAGMNAGENRATATTTSSSFALPTTVPANYDGYAFQAKAGYKADIPNVAAIAPWVTFALGSGRSSTKDSQNKDFQTITNSPSYGFINGNFHSTTGLCSATSNGAPVCGLGSALMAAAGTTGYDAKSAIATSGDTNKIDYGFGVKATPAALSKLTVGAGFWNYWYEHATSTGGNGSAPIALGNRHIGDEIDASVDWKHSDNVSFSLQIGHYMPGGFVNNLWNTIHSGGGTTINGVFFGQGSGPSPENAAEFDTNIKF